ncbi:MAG: hypothetical protein HY735_18140 [Verrucomicrobia bacterium]|nr:hypothetical protein [Verrucomicrobiota bacterium]
MKRLCSLKLRGPSKGLGFEETRQILLGLTPLAPGEGPQGPPVVKNPPGMFADHLTA